MIDSYNVSFNGGFLIKKPSPKMWTQIKEIMPKRKVILENFNVKGDKFFAIKTVYDKDMAYSLFNKALNTNKEKVNFIFYPDINLKTGIDPYLPKESKAIIDSQTRILEGKNIIRQYFKETNIKQQPIPMYRWKPNDHIDQTLKALALQKENCDISIKDGITKIKDKSGKTIAIASPNSINEYNYVYKMPQNPSTSSFNDSDAERIVVNYLGEKVDSFGVLDFPKFREYFMRAVKTDNARKRPNN